MVLNKECLVTFLVTIYSIKLGFVTNSLSLKTKKLSNWYFADLDRSQKNTIVAVSQYLNVSLTSLNSVRKLSETDTLCQILKIFLINYVTANTSPNSLCDLDSTK